MALKDLMKYLQQPGSATPVTQEKIIGLQHKASVYAGCTPVTPVTLQSDKTQEGGQFETVDEASNDPDPPTAKPAPTTGQTYQEWAQSWRPLADAFHAHHFNCAVCIASGKGYGMRCGGGAALWAAYCEAPDAP
jgi:hypothetical protein